MPGGSNKTFHEKFQTLTGVIMTRLESNKVTVDKSAKEVFDFLSDFNNFRKLMPEQVVDWKSTADECTFTIKGMATLGMKIVEKIPDSFIRVVKKGSAP